jgi:single-stranded DNA-specific DHH superfamily exonuclease
MLNEKQLSEIREYLENCRNPIFFFDNDPDGLCSYLLLRRFCGKGKGVIVKSSASVNKQYFAMVDRFNSDCIFVLDKPLIDKDFIEEAKTRNLPLIHIDHHPIEEKKEQIEHFFNPRLVSKTNEPVSDICYRVTRRKEDLWIACAGCISDAFLPDFISDLEKRNPELISKKYKTAFDILYKTELGKIITLMSFALRDAQKNVDSFIRFLIEVVNPSDLFEENDKTRSFLKKYDETREKYSKFLEKAKAEIHGDILFFSYSGDVGLNRDMANELMYLFPEKVISIVFLKNGKANISLRWTAGNIRKIALDAIKGIENALGGGHENALGVQMLAEDVPKFKENLSSEFEKRD